MKSFLPLLSLLLILAACKDPSVKYNQVIQNDSDYAVWLKVYGRPDSTATVFFTVDSFLIESKGELVLLERHGHRNMSQFERCNMYLDSISVRAADTTLVLNKNLNSDTNYVYKEVEKNRKGGGTCECRATFKNSDLD